MTRQHDITCFERAGLHQDGGDRAATFIQACLNHQAFGHGVNGSTQLQHFGLQQHLLQQGINACAGFGRHRHEWRFTTKFFGHHFLHHQFVFHTLGVGVRFVNLVDSNHDGHASRFRVLDGFLGLRHHAVVCRHHQNHDIGGFRAPCTHCREGLVAGGVQERDHAARCFDVVGTNVLGDAAGFA